LYRNSLPQNGENESAAIDPGSTERLGTRTLGGPETFWSRRTTPK
jgi:hypothetical protein